jgi:hypothetical protein
VGTPALHQLSINEGAVLQKEKGQHTAVLIVFFPVKLQTDWLLEY